MATIKTAPMLDATTNDLHKKLGEVFTRLRANGSQLRRLQRLVGEDKQILDDILEELTKRQIDAKVIEIPFGTTMESLFNKNNREAEPE